MSAKIPRWHFDVQYQTGGSRLSAGSLSGVVACLIRSFPAKVTWMARGILYYPGIHCIMPLSLNVAQLSVSK